MELKDLLRTYRERIEPALDHWLPAENEPPELLHRAMRYSTLDGGKRVRAVLVYMTGQVFSVPLQRLDGPACAVEMIHAYSLIHDDLPAMDNDDLRRGKPTCHKAFDDATAILAGDGLQALAFEVLATDPTMTQDPAARLETVRILAHASGTAGMAGGQAHDLAAVGHIVSAIDYKYYDFINTKIDYELTIFNSKGKENFNDLGVYSSHVYNDNGSRLNSKYFLEDKLK